MPSMYETIMELPLFKGIGQEQLSLMLEKTSVEFLKYDDGSIIYTAEQQVRSIDFILSGKVRQTFQLKNFQLSIDEIIGKGGMPGAIHLFGMVTDYTALSRAIGKVSVMRIEKSQYMNLLLSDRIYLLNFVNYLSAAAQKPQSMAMTMKKASIGRTLENLVFSFVSRNTDSVMIVGEDAEMARFCGVSESEFEEWKTGQLVHNRILANNKGIILRSPHLSK